MERRNFLKTAVSTGLGIAGVKAASAHSPAETKSPVIISKQGNTHDKATRELLKKSVFRRKDIDNFLQYNPAQEQWAFFDPELGYRVRDCVVGDGKSGALTFSHFEPTGERKRINWLEKPCRINSYGNSFTMCQQVSDGETWQEYLGAHIGEPIRNFGIGGYGVYQAYLRMLREESSPSSSEYILFNIWSGDHIRSIMRFRWATIKGWRDELPENDGKRLREVRSGMLHATPWDHIKIDPATGKASEGANPFPTAESLYMLCDEEHVYETFKKDLAIQLTVAKETGRFDYAEEVESLCRIFNITGDLNNPGDCKRIALELFQECGFQATKYTLGKAKEFAAKNGKKLLVLLSYGRNYVMKACKQKPRFDQPILDFLKQNNFAYVDSLQKHAEDYRAFRISPEDYTLRFYIGHYRAQGNHFFAFAIKDAVVDLLDPKPPAFEPL